MKLLFNYSLSLICLFSKWMDRYTLGHLFDFCFHTLTVKIVNNFSQNNNT